MDVDRESTKGHPRSYDRMPFPSHRRFVVDAMKAGRRTFPIHGILELDVTDAVVLLDRPDDRPLSFTAFITAATARAACAHPEVQAYRDWFGRLVMHTHVDAAVLVEVEDQGRTFPLAHVLHDAHARSVSSLSDEIRQVAAGSGRHPSRDRLTGLIAQLGRIPGLPALMYAVLRRSPKAREKSGTIAVTSVGMFGNGGGIGIGQPTIMSLSVVVGGRSLRPRVVGDEIMPRLVVDLTISVDHAIVDGAPTARFAATLVDLIEHPQWMLE